MTTTVIDHIGQLVTCDASLGDGPLGVLRDASIVVEEGRVVSIGRAGQVADERIDVEGRCVVPGFVDSHTHLVFGGDRADEFVARMAGRPYRAGGIQSTVAATRTATDAVLVTSARDRRAEALRSGTTTIEIKSGYGLTPINEVRCLEIAERLTDHTTFLGAHVVPPEYAGRADEYVALVCGDMLAACAPHARWIDAFCEQGAFDTDQCREVLRAGRAAGLGTRLHANQLGTGAGVRLAVELGCASVDHCTFLSEADIDALAGGDTVATFLPATEFSTRQPYPDVGRVIAAGATVAIASNCNPGSSYTTSIPFCIALAVREMRMTVEQALFAATAGGAAALREPDIGRLAPGARADLAVLDAPTYTHLAYRPGAQLVAATMVAGQVVAGAVAVDPS
jgi:imidazolonepropionase